MSAFIAANPLLNSRLDGLFSQQSAREKTDETHGTAFPARSFPNSILNAEGGFTPSSQGRVQAARSQQFEQSLHYSETLSLQLTTREGDKVTVDFQQLYSQYQLYKEAQTAEAGPQGVRFFESREAMEASAFEEHFAFAVKGDLNDEELSAIFDVFEQVDELAGTFYEGDLEGALQQAMDLNLDAGQLQSMQLNMSQTMTAVTRHQQSAMAEYQQVQNMGERPETPSRGMEKLPDYLMRWQQTVERMEALFESSRAFVNELMGASLAQQEKTSGEAVAGNWLEKIQNFHDRLGAFAGQSEQSESDMNEKPASSQAGQPLSEAA